MVFGLKRKFPWLKAHQSPLYILIPVQSENLGNAKALAIQRSKMGPYTHMNQFLIVEARGFGTAETSHFELG